MRKALLMKMVRCRRQFCVMLACLACLLSINARGAIVEWPPADVARYPAAIDKAVGYAVVYNPEKVEELTKDLTGSTDPQIRARAWWVRALAWGKYGVNYRDKESVSKFNQARDEAVKADPNVFTDQLATLEVDLQCRVAQPGAGEEFMTKLKKDVQAHPNDPVAYARLGRALYIQYDMADKQDKARCATALNECVKNYEQAVNLAPDNFDFAAYYITYLWERESNKADVVPIAEKVLGRIDPNRSSYSDTQGPLVMLIYIRSMASNEKDLELKLFKESVKRGIRSPEMLAATAKSNVGILQSSAVGVKALLKISPEAAQTWWKFIFEVEEGRVVLHGYDLALLANAYYKLGSFQANQGLWEEALSTYRKLVALSPHYAQLDYNLGICYMKMMERENDDAEKERLKALAIDALQTQIKYTWQGQSRQMIQNVLDQLNNQK